MASKTIPVSFNFSVEDGARTIAPHGRTDCEICNEKFDLPEVETELYWMTICPSCIRRGPKAVAADLEKNAGSTEYLFLACRSDDPRDLTSLKRQYLRVAKTLRQIDSFRDLPGGAIALALATVPPEDVRRDFQSRERKEA